MDTSARAQDSNPLSISPRRRPDNHRLVTSKGAIHLDGQVQGDLHCIALVLGENAQLEGSVVAEDVMVRGRLIGSVRALRVTLQSKSHVEGNLFHKSLSIEQDTHFEGESRPSEDPLSTSSKAPPVEPQSNHNGRLDDGNRGSLKGSIRALPELHSA
jgi:cytoskeletal protein CcmA (bactofilin family)